MQLKNKNKTWVLFLTALLLLTPLIYAQVCSPVETQQALDLNTKIHELKTELKFLQQEARARETLDKAADYKEIELDNRLEVLNAKDQDARISMDAESYNEFKAVNNLEREILEREQRIHRLQQENFARQQQLGADLEAVDSSFKTAQSKVEAKKAELQEKVNRGELTQVHADLQVQEYRREQFKDLDNKLTSTENKYGVAGIKKLRTDITRLQEHLDGIRAKNTEEILRQNFEKGTTSKPSLEGGATRNLLDQSTKEVGKSPEEIARVLREEFSKTGENAPKIVEKPLRSEKSKADLEQLVKDLQSQYDASKGGDANVGRKLDQAIKQLRLEEVIESTERELNDAYEKGDPKEIKAEIEARLNNLKNTKEYRLETSNNKFNQAFEDVVVKLEQFYNKDFKARSRDSLFNVNKNQLASILEALKAKVISGKEFPVGGGKTDVLGPLFMEIGMRFLGRDGLFIAPEGKASEVFYKLESLFNSIGRELTHIDRVEGSKELLARIQKKGGVIIVESGKLEFGLAELKSGRALPGETKAQTEERLDTLRKVLDAILKNRQVVIDEAHLALDGKRQFRIGSGGDLLSKNVKENALLVRDVLRTLNLFEEGAFGKWKTNTKNKYQKDAKGKETDYFTKDFLADIARELAKKKGYSEQEVLDVFREPTKQPKDMTESKYNELLDLLDTVKEFGSAAKKKIESDYFDHVDSSDFSKNGIKPAHNGNGQPNQQLNKPVQAAVMEVVGAQAYGRDPYLNNVRSGGKSVTATVQDVLDYLMHPSSNSQIMLMTGTIGSQQGSHLLSRGIEWITIPEVQERMLGIDKDGNSLPKVDETGQPIRRMVEEGHIEGIGERDFLDVFLEKPELYTQNDHVALTTPAKGVNPKDYVYRLLEDSRFNSIDGKLREGIYRNADGDIVYVKRNTGFSKLLKGKYSEQVINEVQAEAHLNRDDVGFVLILGEGGSTGTSIFTNKDIPWVHFSSTEVPLYLQLQALGRAGRQGAFHDSYVLVQGEKGILSNKEAYDLWKTNEIKENSENNFQTMDRAVDRMLDKFLFDVVKRGVEGTKTSIVRRLLEEFQTRNADARDLSTAPELKNSLESLQTKLEATARFVREQLLTNKELLETLTQSELNALKSMSESPGKLTFASKRDSTITRSIDEATSPKDFADLFGKIVERDMIPESTTGQDTSFVINGDLASHADFVKQRQADLRAKKDELNTAQNHYNQQFNVVTNSFNKGDKIIVDSQTFTIELGDQGMPYLIGTDQTLHQVIEQAIAQNVLVQVNSKQSGTINFNLNELKNAQINLDRTTIEFQDLFTVVDQAENTLKALNTMTKREAGLTLVRVLENQGFSSDLINNYFDVAMSTLSEDELRKLAILGSKEVFANEEAKQAEYAGIADLFFSTVKSAKQDLFADYIDTSDQTPKIQSFHQEQQKRNNILENLINSLLEKLYFAEGVNPQEIADLNNILFNLRKEKEQTQKQIEQLGLFEHSELRQSQLNTLQQLKEQAKQLIDRANKAYSSAGNLRNKLSPEEQKTLDELIRNIETLSSEAYNAQNKPSELQQNLYLVPPITIEDSTQEQLSQKAKELKQKIVSAEEKLRKLIRNQLIATEEEKPNLEKQIILAEELLNELKEQLNLVNIVLPEDQRAHITNEEIIRGLQNKIQQLESDLEIKIKSASDFRKQARETTDELTAKVFTDGAEQYEKEAQEVRNEIEQLRAELAQLQEQLPETEAPARLSTKEQADLLSSDVATIIAILESLTMELPSDMISSTQELISFLLNVQRSNAEAIDLFKQGNLRAYFEKIYEGTLAQALGIVNALIDNPRAKEFTPEQVEKLKQLNLVIRKARQDAQKLLEQTPIKIEEEKRVEETSAERARKVRAQLTQSLDQTIEGLPVPIYAFNKPLEGEFGGDLIFTTSPKERIVRVLHLDATGHGELGAKHKAGLAIAIQRLENKVKTGEIGRTLYEDLEYYLKALQEEIAQVKAELKEQGLSEEELAEYDPLGTFAAYDYNTETGEITYSTGGEEKNFFHYTEGKVGAALKSRGQKLGEEGIKIDATQMKAGDLFVIVSDGVTDVIKSKDLKKLIEDNAGKSEEEIAKAIQDKYEENKQKLGEEYEQYKDDISIVVMKAKTETTAITQLTQDTIDSLEKDCSTVASVGCTINFGELEENVDYFKTGVERVQLEQGIERVMQKSGLQKEFIDQPWFKSLSTKDNELSIVINANGKDSQKVLDLLKDQERSEEFWQAIVSIPLLRKHLQLKELSNPELEDTKTLEEIKTAEDPKFVAEQKAKEFAQKYNVPFIDATNLEKGRIIGRGRNKELTSIIVDGKEYVPQTWGVDELELKMMSALQNVPNSAKLLGITTIIQEFRGEIFYVPVMLIELITVNGQPAKNLLDAKEVSKDFFQKLENAIRSAHEKGYFHGDLIERNVLVDKNGDPILIDWTFTRLGQRDLQKGKERDLESLGIFKELHGWKIKKEATLEELIQTDCGSGGSVSCTFDYTNTGIKQDILDTYLMTEQNKQKIIKAAEEVMIFLDGIYNKDVFKLLEKEQPGNWVKDVIFEGSEVKIIINTKAANAEKILDAFKDKSISKQVWDKLSPFELLLYANIMRSEDLIKNIDLKLDKVLDETPIKIDLEERVAAESEISEEDISDLELILAQTEATFEQLTNRDTPIGQQVGKATKLGQGRFGIAWKVGDKVIKVLDIEDNDALSSASTISDTGLTPEYDFVRDEYVIGQYVRGDSRFIQVEGVVKGNSELIKQGEKLIIEGTILLNSLETSESLIERFRKREITNKEYLQLAKKIKEQEQKAKFLKNKGEYLINLAKKGSGLIATISKYYEGQTLDVLRDQQKTLSTNTVSKIEQVINEALNDLHEGITKDGKTIFLTHGDIKPANLLIQPDGTPIIMDLGVSTSYTTKNDIGYVYNVYIDSWRKYVTINRARAMQELTEISTAEFEKWYVDELKKIIQEHEKLGEDQTNLEHTINQLLPSAYKKEALTSKQGTIATLRAKAVSAGKIIEEQHEELLKQAEELDQEVQPELDLPTPVENLISAANDLFKPSVPEESAC